MAGQFHLAINFDKGEVPVRKYGVVKNIKCNMICVSPIGSYKEPVADNVADQIQYLFDWTNQVGFPKTKCAKYEELAKTGGALSLYLAPNIVAKSAKMRAFGKYCMWLLLMDDIMDERTMEDPPTTTYLALSADLKVLVEVLNGTINGKTDAPEQTSTMSHYKVLCSVVQEIHEVFKEHLPGFACPENRRHLVRRTNDFLHAFLWRFGRKNQMVTSEDTYLFFRRHHSASYCIFEIVCLLNDMDWGKSKIDRDHVEFNNWLNSHTNSLSMSNDILSLRKELTDDETENLVVHKWMNQSLEINDAINKCLQFTNAASHEMKEYGKRLTQHNPELETMARMVEFTNWSIDGHLHWYGYSQRYGPMKLKQRHLTDEEYEAILNDHTRNKSKLVQIW